MDGKHVTHCACAVVRPKQDGRQDLPVSRYVGRSALLSAAFVFAIVCRLALSFCRWTQCQYWNLKRQELQDFRGSGCSFRFGAVPFVLLCRRRARGPCRATGCRVVEWEVHEPAFLQTLPCSSYVETGRNGSRPDVQLKFQWSAGFWDKFEKIPLVVAQARRQARPTTPPSRLSTAQAGPFPLKSQRIWKLPALSNPSS